MADSQENPAAGRPAQAQSQPQRAQQPQQPPKKWHEQLDQLPQQGQGQMDGLRCLSQTQAA